MDNVVLPFHSDMITQIDTESNPHIMQIHTKNGKIWTIYKRRSRFKLSKKVRGSDE